MAEEVPELHPDLQPRDVESASPNVTVRAGAAALRNNVAGVSRDSGGEQEQQR